MVWRGGGVYANAGGGVAEKGSEGVVQIPLEIIKRISSAAGYTVPANPGRAAEA